MYQSRKMKDSGIDWIGQIPEDWNIAKSKYICNIYTGNSIKDEEKDNYIDSVNAHPYLATKDIDASFGTANYNNGLFVKDYDRSFKIAHKHSTLMCIEGGSAGKKKHYLKIDVSFVNKLCCFEAKTINSKYLYYYLSSPNYEEQFRTNIDGLIGGVSVSKLKNFCVSFPSIEIQTRIADYLDDKCGKIDRYIEKQQQIIEKLKEYKQAVITEAVTKGLGPTVPMKDSGIEWIGMIPEHWKVTKIGNLFSFIGGYAFNSDDYVSETNNMIIRIGNVKNNQLLLNANPVYVSNDMAQNVEKFKLQDNDILFTMTGTKGKRDYFYTLILSKTDISENNLFLNQRVGCFRKKADIYPTYYNYLLKDTTILDSIFIYETGTANQGNLGIDSISRTKVHFPPISEQIEIAQYLEFKCDEIDSAISKQTSIIEKLTEYKKSLIYEAVTGKLEV